jgi:malonate decarboxylase delta subunit
MENLTFKHTASSRANGSRETGIVGVVTSGNLEVLLEKLIDGLGCEFHISTPLKGYGRLWGDVITAVVERSAAGGLRISVNDGGAAPDTVTLRLLQGIALMQVE